MSILYFIYFRHFDTDELAATGNGGRSHRSDGYRRAAISESNARQKQKMLALQNALDQANDDLTTFRDKNCRFLDEQEAALTCPISYELFENPVVEPPLSNVPRARGTNTFKPRRCQFGRDLSKALPSDTVHGERQQEAPAEQPMIDLSAQVDVLTTKSWPVTTPLSPSISLKPQLQLLQTKILIKTQEKSSRFQL
ncbi:hypothetical protein GN244_ATG09212 [Phytophthora infestans]|uniref:Uncharacterized protein n=1 Tax=Phytophthora infestans TaxID=4787 RepID=A0A833T8M6_PHYIN|nr:hypothetical protein GN244_ATG09212 [Phytophthora infestans]